MDVTKLLHVFLGLCQPKPRWSLTNIQTLLTLLTRVKQALLYIFTFYVLHSYFIDLIRINGQSWTGCEGWTKFYKDWQAQYYQSDDVGHSWPITTRALRRLWKDKDEIKAKFKDKIIDIFLSKEISIKFAKIISMSPHQLNFSFLWGTF